jgi:hypothetical protein
MKTETQSNNTRYALGIKDLLVPTGPQLALDFVLAFLLLTLLKIRGLWAYFTQGILDASQSDISDIINQKAQSFHHFLNSISQGRALQIVFWLFVGCIVYIFIWFIRSLITGVRNDMIADTYVHPFSYSRSVFWQSVISRKLFFVAMTGIFIAYLVTGVKLAIALANLCYSSIESSNYSSAILRVAISLIITAVLVQIFIILLRLLGRAWKLIYTDL